MTIRGQQNVQSVVRSIVMPPPVGDSLALPSSFQEFVSYKSGDRVSNGIERFSWGKTQAEVLESNSGQMVEASLPSQCSRDDKDKLTLALSTLLDFLVLYGFNKSSFDPTSTLSHWQQCSAECGWMKFLKYKFSAFFSDHLGTELPPVPFSTSDHPRHLTGGRASRFVDKLMKTPRALGFATGVLYLKKGMPRPDEKMLVAAKLATKKVLTHKRPVPTSSIPNPANFISRDVFNITDMEGEVRRTCREIFGRYKISDRVLHHPRAPSIRANYVDSRSKLGTFGTLIEKGLITDFFPERRRPLTVQDRQADMVKSLYMSVVEDKVEEEMEEEGYTHKSVSNRFRNQLKWIYTDVYERARAMARTEQADVKLVALPESLKIRVISKGPPLTYFVLKPVQKFLHGILRRHPMFRLIGEPVSSQILNEKFATVSGLFHSLDYSSATDFLNPFLSECAVDEICSSVGMPDDLRLLFLKALTGHTVEGDPQVWGQLMGSVVSFIILCVVNGAVIRRSLEVLYSREIKLRDCDALVNGDDGAVRAPAAFLPIWKDLAALCGLEPSQGKVYSHPTYLNINSTSYTLQHGLLYLVPYVNMGLMKGLKRSGGKVGVQDVQDPEGPETLGARHHELLSTCPESMVVACHKMFLKEHWDILSKVSVPFYVSEAEGGVGLMPVKKYNTESMDIDDHSWEYEFGPSELDLQCLELLHSGSCVIPVAKLPTAQPIQVRQIWSSRVRLARSDHSLELSDDDVGLLDVSTFFLTPRLVADRLTKSASEVLHNNQRAWRLLTHLALSGEIR